MFEGKSSTVNSLPSSNSKFRQTLVFLTPDITSFLLQLIFSMSLAQSKQIFSLDKGEAHGQSIVCVGVACVLLVLSVITVKALKRHKKLQHLATPCQSHIRSHIRSHVCQFINKLRPLIRK